MSQEQLGNGADLGSNSASTSLSWVALESYHSLLGASSTPQLDNEITLLSPWVAMRDTQCGPVIPRAQHPAPRKRPVPRKHPAPGKHPAVGGPLVMVPSSAAAQHLAVQENTDPSPLSPRLARSLPERSTCDCWTLSLCSSVSSWQPSAWATPAGETLCVHPSPPSSDDHLEYWQQREGSPSHGVWDDSTVGWSSKISPETVCKGTLLQILPNSEGKKFIRQTGLPSSSRDQIAQLTRKMFPEVWKYCTRLWLIKTELIQIWKLSKIPATTMYPLKPPCAQGDMITSWWGPSCCHMTLGRTAFMASADMTICPGDLK